VYFFNRVDGQWQEHGPRLRAPDPSVLQLYGDAVAISGSLAVVGARWDDERGENAGAVYVYRRQSGAWSLVTKLMASNAQPGDEFGYSVSIDGSSVLVGARWADRGGNVNRGAAYVLRELGGTWYETELPAVGLLGGDEFGFAASLDGLTAAVGARWHGVGGAVFVFDRSGSTWVQTQVLAPDTLMAGNRFGFSVSMNGDELVGGAPFVGGHGEAYMYERSAGTWDLADALQIDTPMSGDRLGTSVATSSGLATVGARWADDHGMAHLFGKTDTGWQYIDALGPPDDLGLDDEFGQAVGMSGTRVIVGGYRHDGVGVDSGAAWIYEVRRDVLPCPADLNGDGLLDFFDIQIFLNGWSVCDEVGDWIPDGQCDFFDLQYYLNDFEANCP